MKTNYFVSVFGFLNLLSLVLGHINIVTRTEWNATDPGSGLTPLNLPAGRVIIAHTAGNKCDTKESCKEEVRSIQNFHMSKMNFSDISYNFLIRNDGNVYEGRSWNFQGAVVKGYNAGSFGLAFIGNFINELPSQNALGAAKSLLEKLVTTQKLKRDYKIYGHSQLTPTISPGDALLAEIKKWPNWSNQV